MRAPPRRGRGQPRPALERAPPKPDCGRTATARRARCAAAACSSARCQRPAYQSTQRPVPEEQRPRAFVASRGRLRLELLEDRAGRSISPRRISCLPSQTRGLSMNSSSSPRRSSISAPRSSRPGVISAPHVSACAHAARSPRRAGQDRRPARPSPAPRGRPRAPRGTSAASRWKRLRRARIRAERASSPAASRQRLVEELDHRRRTPP